MKIKRIISLILVLCICISLVPVKVASITQSEFDAKLSSLRTQYPNYSTWTDRFDGGSQCFGFARLIGYNVFGTYPSSWTKVYSIDGVKPGDLLQYGNTSGSGHTVFVTSVSGNTITFVDCNGNGNYSGGNQVRTCGIKWDNTISKNARMFGKYSFSYLLSSPGLDSPGNAPASHLPVGAIDAVITDTQKVTINGWAFDEDNLDHSVGIHIYIGDKIIGAGTANLYNPGVDATYYAGEYHGFIIECNIPYGLTGTQTIDVYALDESGNHPRLFPLSSNVSLTVDIPADTEAPVISDVKISEINTDGYTITCTVTDNTGLMDVKFPTWTEPAQDDLLQDWAGNASASGTRNGDTFSYRVLYSNHNDEHERYVTHIYAWDNFKNETVYGIGEMNFNLPVGGVDSIAAGSQQVRLQGWSSDKDDDSRSVAIHVYIGSTFVGGGYTDAAHKFDIICTIPSNLVGKQTLSVYAIDQEYAVPAQLFPFDDSVSMTVDIPADTKAPEISNVSVFDVDETGFSISCTVTDENGVDRVQFPTWTRNNEQDDLLQDWQINPEASGAVNGNTYTFRVNTSAHNDESGKYATHIYAYDIFGNESCYAIPDVLVPCLDTAHQDTNNDGLCDVCKTSMLLGDLNLDGEVDSDDLTLLARHVGGIEILSDEVALYNADVNEDGQINSDDLTKHARYVGGIITSWGDA